MRNDYNQYEFQLKDIVQSGITLISDIKPSVWTEQNVVMQKPFPGPFKYSRTPYTKEIIDCLSQDHPARTISVMKGAQIGFSAGVIFPGCAWIIKNNPGNTFITVGAPDLIEKATEKLDIVITNSGLRNYIKPQVQRKRNNKSGDTNFKKEFSGGYINITSANNHKAIRDVSLQYGFFDDFESVKSNSKESGSTRKLLLQRFAAYADTRKVFFISTPERDESSNIKPAYLLGDQRKYLIPCPHCGSFIELKWLHDIDDKNKAGIHWELDNHNKVILESVGYICQECAGFFDDKNKFQFLNDGNWKPTAEPSELGNYSYHISSLYAPLGMYDWKHYVNDYMEANPVGKPKIEPLQKSFTNLCLGETYVETGEAPKATELQNNVRQYSIGIIPEKLSEKDGNGKIVMITCAIDFNGIVTDARADYEVVAWSETGSCYSVTHGSIGTFIPREGEKKTDRPYSTYEHHKKNSVWPEIDKLLTTDFKTDTGRQLRIFITAFDTGHYNEHIYPYIDSCVTKKINAIAVKGDKEYKYVPFEIDKPKFKRSQERVNLYMLQVGKIKDNLADLMKLKCSENEIQPPGFMNYPTPADGKYLFKNYFKHYESEQRVVEFKEDGSTQFIWKKKSTISQNHFWDCRVYNLAVRDILVSIFGKELKQTNFGWAEYVNTVCGRK